MKNVIILCSGGIDSTTTAYYIKKKLRYEKIIILFFNYGQKSLKQEKKFSKKCAAKIGGDFIELDIKTLKKVAIPLFNKKEKILNKKSLKDTKKESRGWYMPCRNVVFLVYALALAESIYAKKKKKFDIFVGFKNEGKESYPDTTQEFVNQMNKLSKISCYKHFKIKSPFIKKDKEDIIHLGLKLGVNFKDTFSCYSSIKEKHCGYCLACRLRQAGFYWAGIKDLTEYYKK